VRLPILPQVQGLPRDVSGSAPLFARHWLLSELDDDAAVFASCYGPRGCRPSCASPTWSRAPAVEGSYFRAFPHPGRPGRGSGMTTPHHRAIRQPDFRRQDHLRYTLRYVHPTPQISGGAFRLFCQPCRSNFCRSPAPSAASGCWAASSFDKLDPVALRVGHDGFVVAVARDSRRSEYSNATVHEPRNCLVDRGPTTHGKGDVGVA